MKLIPVFFTVPVGVHFKLFFSKSTSFHFIFTWQKKGWKNQFVYSSIGDNATLCEQIIKSLSDYNMDSIRAPGKILGPFR